MNYTTEMGPKLTQWVIDRIKRDYPDDVALLIGVEHCSPDGSGHGECFDYFVPANERGLGLERSIVIDGVHHDLYNRDWARCERTASLEDWATFCLADGEILYSRSPEDTARFEALRQQLKDNLANPEFTYRKALELLDDAMNLYRNMMFEERPHHVRMAAGYIFNYLLSAVLYLNGSYYLAHHEVQPHQLARCKAQPEHFAAYYQAMLSAKSAGELRSVAHLMIQTARHFIAAHKPGLEKNEFSTDYKWLAGIYAEMTLTWRRLRFYCEQGNADAAFTDACWLQNVMHNEICGEFGMPDMDILGAFDCGNLMALSEQSSDVERRVGEWIAERTTLVPDYATFEEFAEKNP